MTLELIDNYSIPEYSLPYFINGDKEGYTEEDIQIMSNWLNSFGYPIEIEPPNETDSTFFTWNPAFGLACICYELKVFKITI